MTDPVTELRAWQRQAERLGGFGGLAAWAKRRLGKRFGELPGADAVALATATPSGAPSVRMVLAKEITPAGIVFYTNYQSRKGEELAANPQAALLFHFRIPPRQVRVEGPVEKLSAAENARYWDSRSRGSQISALASDQSQTVPSPETLRDRVRALETEYAGRDVPCPPHWGGYRVLPQRFEFWEARPNRLHERRLFSAQADGSWQMKVLAP